MFDAEQFENQFSHENELLEGTELFDVDGSPEHPRGRWVMWKGKKFWHVPAVHPPQTFKLNRIPSQNYSDPSCWTLAPYSDELRKALETEDKKDYSYAWKKADELNPNTPEGLARNMWEREKWFRTATKGTEKLEQQDFVPYRKVPGHSLSNDLKKQYKDTLGTDFSPATSEDITNRAKRVGGCLGTPDSFDDRYIRELWDLGNEAENTLGRAMYLGQLKELKKSADKVAKEELTPLQYKVYEEMFETSNLSVIAAQLGKSPQQIQEMQSQIMKKIRKALNLPEPKEVKYETKNGPEWNPIRLNMQGRTRMGQHDPNDGMEFDDAD